MRRITSREFKGLGRFHLVFSKVWKTFLLAVLRLRQPARLPWASSADTAIDESQRLQELAVTRGSGRDEKRPVPEGMLSPDASS
jgi:hypothetical protein